MNTLRKLRLGLLVNPFAGIGGALALKGSDGKKIRELALSAGAKKMAMSRMATALLPLVEYKEQVFLITACGDMGENTCRDLDLPHQVVYVTDNNQSEAEDTIQAAAMIANQQVDLLLFAGGDGTARNIFSAIGDSLPVIGIPAGCKIHSGVYAVTPQAAGQILLKLLNGELLSLMSSEVRDIDEEQFRDGRVLAKYFGEMRVPADLEYIQSVKMGGKESDELVLLDIADAINELMDDHPEHCFIVGSGGTLDYVMNELSIENTLLGIDILYRRKAIAKDVSAAQLLDITNGRACKLLITAIGGQGHIFGRGNQQLSDTFIKSISRKDIHIIATKNKIKQLGNKGFIADTGDTELDSALAGSIEVITGYNDRALYFVRD